MSQSTTDAETETEQVWEVDDGDLYVRGVKVTLATADGELDVDHVNVADGYIAYWAGDTDLALYFEEDDRDE